MTPDPDRLIFYTALHEAWARGEFGLLSEAELIKDLPSITIVRHGQTASNIAHKIHPSSADVPTEPVTIESNEPYPYVSDDAAKLTSTGRAQASTAAHFIASTSKPVRIYTSPQERAYETARAIARRTDTQHLVVCPQLKERDYGPYAGIATEEIAAYCASRNQNATSLFTPDELIQAVREDGSVAVEWVNQFPKYRNEQVGENWPDTRHRMAHECIRIVADAMQGSKPSEVIIVSHRDPIRSLLCAVHGISWKEGLTYNNAYVNSIQNGDCWRVNLSKAAQDMMPRYDTLDRPAPDTRVIAPSTIVDRWKNPETRNTKRTNDGRVC